VVGGLGLLGGIPAVLFGPWLLRTLLGAPSVLGSSDLLWFSAGTVFYMLAMVVGQALVAMDRHRLQLVGWALGTAVLVGVSCIHGSVAVRVEVSYFLGSLVAALVMLAFVLRSPGRRGKRKPSATVDGGADSGSPGSARQQRLSTDIF
jgi:O-antigen/teichoic acid export membrane protein